MSTITPIKWGKAYSKMTQHPSFAAFHQALRPYRQSNREAVALSDRNAIYTTHKTTMITIAKDVALAYCCKVFAVPAEQRIWDRLWPLKGVDFNAYLATDFFNAACLGRRMNGELWFASGNRLVRCAINAVVRLIQWIVEKLLRSMELSRSLEKFSQNRAIV